MRVALVAPPFIAIRRPGMEEPSCSSRCSLGGSPPTASRSCSIGASHVPCELRWTYRDADWPIDDPHRASLKNLTHSSWAVRDAADHCDVIHVNDVAALLLLEFVDVPFVHTLHHPHVDVLSKCIRDTAAPHYIAISDFQRRQERLSRCQTIYHGIDASQYTFVERKQDYLCFLGRMTPCKAPHLAIEIARRTGLPQARRRSPAVVCGLLGARGQAAPRWPHDRVRRRGGPSNEERAARQRARCCFPSSGTSRSA